MSLYNLVHRKYSAIMPLDGYAQDKGWFWVYDRMRDQVRYYREEREAWNAKEKLCDAAWNDAINRVIVELRLMYRD